MKTFPRGLKVTIVFYMYQAKKNREKKIRVICTLKESTSTVTTAKTSSTKSNTIIGYVPHLSPGRKKRDTMDYSTLVLQTSVSVIE